MHKRFVRGESIARIFNHVFLNDIVDVLNFFKRGGFARREQEPDVVHDQLLCDITPESYTRTVGDIQQIDAPTIPDESDDLAMFMVAPAATVSDPTWHDGIDNLVVVSKEASDDDPFFHSVYKPLQIVAVTSQVKTTDRWVMVDPSTPHQCITSDAGMWKIIAFNGADHCLVDTSIGSFRWRFELTEPARVHPLTTGAKLIRMDGDEFASSIQLTDPTGILENTGATTGTIGQCIHSGNFFYPDDVDCT